VEVFSVASIVNFVDRIDVPLSLMSTVTVPVVVAPVNDARTPVTVIAYGIRNVVFVPVAAMAVDSSEQATPISTSR